MYARTCVHELLQLPALLYSQFSMNTKLGRKLNIIMCFLLSGAFLLLIPFVPHGKAGIIELLHHNLCSSHLILFVTCAALSLISILRADANWLIITLAILGRWGVTATWNFLYMITSEVYPTPLRSIGLASCSMVGRIGGVVSPFISQMVGQCVFI